MMTDSDRTLPASIEAEASLLGSILLDPETLAAIAENLKPDDFYRESHRLIYDAMVALMTDNTTIDVVTIADQLSRRNRLDDAGGRHYILSLLNAVPSWLHAQHYADIILRTSRMRGMVAAAGKIAAMGYDDQMSPDDALERAASLIFSLGNRRQGKSTGCQAVSVDLDAIQAALQPLYDYPGERSATGVPTGYADLDFILGGLEPGTMTLLAARPRIGKSALALNISWHIADHLKGAVAFFSMEMARTEQIKRLLALVAKVDGMRFRTGPLPGQYHDYPDLSAEWNNITYALGRIQPLKLFFDETRGSVPYIRNVIRKLSTTNPLDMVIVDYLQLCKASAPATAQGEYAMVSEVAQDLKELAMEMKIPILALAQLNRDPEKRASKVPGIADLRGSGVLEQAADNIIFLSRPDQTDEWELTTPQRKVLPIPVDVIVAKQRNGREGQVKLMYDGPYFQFSPVIRKADR